MVIPSGVVHLSASRAKIATHTQVDQWDFDPFELDRVTQGHSLVTLSVHLFSTKYNLFSRFAFSKVQ